MPKNGKKWQKNSRKLQIIVKFQKLLNMVKKMTTIYTNLQKFTKIAKNAKNEPKTSSFFWLETTSNKQAKQRSLLCAPLGVK